jgi:hypothetical protein
MPGMEMINGSKLVNFYCIFLGKDVPSSPLDQVLELASGYTTIHEFFLFIFLLDFNNNGFWGRYDIAQ